MTFSSIAQRVAIATATWNPERFADGFATLSLLSTATGPGSQPWFARLLGADRLELWQEDGPWLWFDAEGFGQGHHSSQRRALDGHPDLRKPWLQEAQVIERFQREGRYDLNVAEVQPGWFEPLADLCQLDESIRAAMSIDARSGLSVELRSGQAQGLRLERPSPRTVQWIERVQRPWLDEQAHAAFALAAMEVRAVTVLGARVTLTWRLADI